MPRKKKHLKTVREFLGYDGNPDIHDLLDRGPIHLHRLTHDPYFIDSVIFREYGIRGEVEAWLHLLEDWGIYS